MRRHLPSQAVWLGPFVLIALFLVSAMLFMAPQAQPPSAGSPPVVFLHDPLWPEYAQTEITVFPEPPSAGRPTEICVWVLNNSDTPQTVTIDFGAANFGIGLPFTPVGSRTITVAAQGRGVACLHWVPGQPGHWCIQAILHLAGFADQISQRNVDLWEVLQPGTAKEEVFLVRNPLASAVTMRLQPKINPARSNWGILLSPSELQLNPEQTVPVTLTVTPPKGVLLGTREYIVDVEATALVGQQLQLMGGFRKLDWPPVQLHRQRDPIYAESEISVTPYPPRAGEPVRICVELTNHSDLARTVQVGFELARLGIGLPWTPIDTQTVTIAAHATILVCTHWVPPLAGQFCVQIVLHDPQNVYVDQRSQRNLDVNEILLPNVETSFIFPVRNPDSNTRTIYLTAKKLSSFFDLRFDQNPLANVLPGQTVSALLWVKLKLGALPEDDTPIADVEAYYLNNQ